MERDRRVRVYDAHSWTGISLGLFLFVVSFTGSLALFFHEIQTWEDPARRLTLPAEPVPVQPLFDAWVEQFPAEEVTFTGVEYPSAYEPYYSGRLNHQPPEGDAEFYEIRWNASTGAVIPERGDGLAVWLLDFHRDLMWPDFLGGRQIGRGLVGIAGVIMLLSILTGILTHRKILKEFFTFRREKSVRVKWKDSHNFLGIWTLPFSIMIAFTGAWLGIVVLLLPLTGVLVFKGDTEAVATAVVGEQIERAGIEAPMLSFDTIAARAHHSSGNTPVSVFVQHYGDQNAQYTINYKPETELRYFDVEVISGVTGERQPNTGLLEPAASTRVIAAVSPLHYGTYGGIALKLLYLGLGLALSAMVALGNMVWIERRANSAEGSRSPQFYDRLSRLTVGVCMGVVVASVAIFYGDAFYTGAEEDRIFFVGSTYFAVWFAAILYAFLPSTGYRATRGLLFASGVGLLGLPVVSTMVAGGAPWVIVASGHAAAPAVDLTLAVLGALSIAVALRLPQERRDPKGKARRVKDQPAQGELSTNPT